jgi:hypothetical protein
MAVSRRPVGDAAAGLCRPASTPHVQVRPIDRFFPRWFCEKLQRDLLALSELLIVLYVRPSVTIYLPEFLLNFLPIPHRRIRIES